MSLSLRLDGIEMSHPCPNCGLPTQRRGAWFKVIRQYHCDGCRKPVTLTYETKLKLFSQAERQLASLQPPEPKAPAPLPAILESRRRAKSVAAR